MESVLRVLRVLAAAVVAVLAGVLVGVATPTAAHAAEYRFDDSCSVELTVPHPSGAQVVAGEARIWCPDTRSVLQVRAILHHFPPRSAAPGTGPAADPVRNPVVVSAPTDVRDGHQATAVVTGECVDGDVYSTSAEVRAVGRDDVREVRETSGVVVTGCAGAASGQPSLDVGLR